MNPQKFVITTVVGAVVSFLLGGAIYAWALADFFVKNVGSATGVMKDPPLMWAIAISELTAAALLTLIIGGWAKATSAGEGVKLGAVFGLMIAIIMDFGLFGTSNTMNMTATVVDPVISLVRFAITGGVIGAMVARKS